MDFLLTLLFYQIEPYKKGPFLVLLSSIAKMALFNPCMEFEKIFVSNVF